MPLALPRSGGIRSAFTIVCRYGSGASRATLYVAETRTGAYWYVCHGSVTVYCTHERPEEGCNIEEFVDHDMFTACNLHGITSEEELIEAIES